MCVQLLSKSRNKLIPLQPANLFLTVLNRLVELHCYLSHTLLIVVVCVVSNFPICSRLVSFFVFYTI